MPTRRAGVTAIAVIAGTAFALLSGGCVGNAPAQPDGRPSTSVAAQASEPRGQLAARVAAAKDRRYGAAYSLAEPGKAGRLVLVTVAADATWRVDVQGGALGGSRDVAIVGRPDGQFQCPLNPSEGCVRVAAPGKQLPAAVDPQVHSPFSLWLDVMLDRQVPLSVASAQPLPGASGTCFNIEPAVTALQPPIDAGVFCYSDDGLLTAAKLSFGTLTLNSTPITAPPTAMLPAAVVNTQPLSTTAPPPPSPTVTAVTPAPSGSRGASARPSGTKRP